MAALVLWTVLAAQWMNSGCDPLTSYSLVITNGTPSVWEGCGEDAPIDVTRE
ncbi:hypothetical protein ACFRJ1_22045 [Streptomyces sp. NPDC056773]|uniref:hypothetical protein n=1 Tax=unclassified Streptomyces TaxID=2593676 RepID=UPI0036AD3EBA